MPAPLTATPRPEPQPRMCAYCGRNPAQSGTRHCSDEHARWDAGNETNWRRAS